jgi:hypothetical protein
MSDINNLATIESNSTPQIKTGLGRLVRVCVNTKGAASNVLTLYDGTGVTGTLLATIDTTDRVGHIDYDVPFKTGLYAVLATGTAAKVTIVYG